MVVLFPTDPTREDFGDPAGIADTSMFSETELMVVVSSLRNRKVPGPDGAPSEVLTVVVLMSSSFAAHIQCLPKSGRIPAGSWSGGCPVSYTHLDVYKRQ